MSERCWEELRRAGKALAEEPGERHLIVNTVSGYFEVPSSPEAEAVAVFLDGLAAVLEAEELFAVDDPPPEAEAAQ